MPSPPTDSQRGSAENALDDMVDIGAVDEVRTARHRAMRCSPLILPVYEADVNASSEVDRAA